MNILRHVGIGNLGCIIHLEDSSVVYKYDTEIKVCRDTVESMSKSELSKLIGDQDWSEPQCWQEPTQEELNDYDRILFSPIGSPV